MGIGGDVCPSQIRGRLWGALCTQYWEGDNLTQEEIKRDTTVVITVFQHRTAAGLEAIELELVVVEKPARMSAAKGVRRHGVDPNRSRNEEVMIFISLSLLSPVSSLSPPAAALARDLPPFPTSHRPPRLELISETGAKQTSTRRPTFPYPPPPLPWSESAGICHGSRRFVRMPSELPAARSPPFLNQISRVRYQEPDRILKGDLRGIEVARTICRRSTRDPPPGQS
ncbi:F-box family protein with DUF295 [Prunus dulcis]|uniref:F-box family protein with DUF295 n=1 Tax=Prunus dulcis TaxID=3755 RepID=A0A5H2XQF4_PRUDU|nr:F-box family protein with DUF295 [Prunus dulcis]